MLLVVLWFNPARAGITLITSPVSGSTVTITAGSTEIIGITPITLCGMRSVKVTDYTGTTQNASYGWYDSYNYGYYYNWTTTTPGTYTCTITAIDNCGVTSTSTITIIVASPATISYSSPVTGTVGTALTITPTTTGAITSYSLTGTLPPGLSFSTSTGVISGTPTAASSATTYTVTANYPGGSVSTTVNISIVAPALNTANYNFKQTITLNTSLLNISSPLINFPYLVYIQESALKADTACDNNVQFPYGDGSGATASSTGSGYDFAFTTTAAPTTELFYQVDSFDPATGTLLVWVQVPGITATSQNLNFYFGSSAPGHSIAFAQATWSGTGDNYLGVYHMNEGSNTAAVIDATANGNNAVQHSTTSTTGEVSKGYSFNGNAYITTNSTSMNLTGSFTLSAWVEPTAFPKQTGTGGSGEYDYKILTNEGSYATAGYKLGLYGTATTAVYSEVETRTTSGTETLDRSTSTQTAATLNTWHHIQGVYDASTGKFYSYLDGKLTNSSTGAASGSSASVLYFGTDFAYANDLTGYMDEARLSSDAKSADWIKAEYYNQSNPSACTTYNSAITYSGSSSAGSSVVYTWLGSSTDPAQATNWTSYSTSTALSFTPAFDGKCSLVIPVVTSGKYPALTADMSVYGLTIASGASLNLNGHTLTVGCHIYNSLGGQILCGNNSGGLTWAGSITTQHFYGKSGSYTNLANMTVSNTATGGAVAIDGGGVVINNTLTLTQGSLNVIPHNGTSAALSLMSTSNKTATVATIPSGSSITGTVNVQRYITGSPTATTWRGYRLLSVPVNDIAYTTNKANYTNFKYLNATSAINGSTYYGAYTAGSGGTTNGFNYTKSSNPTIYLFDEALPVVSGTAANMGFTTGKYAGLTSMLGTNPGVTNTLLSATSAQVPAGNGFLLFYIGSTKGRPTSTNPEASNPDSAQVTYTGYLNQGSVPVYLWHTVGASSAGQLSYTTPPTGSTYNYQGYNMLGNPYASSINLDSVYYDNKTAITGAFYELENPGQTYVCYDATHHTSSGTNYSACIASGQGFFVVASGTGKTFTFYEKEKVSQQLTASSSPATMLAAVRHANANVPTGLHLQLTVDSLNYKQTGIYFSNVWSDNYNFGEDAIDLDGASPKAYLSSYSADGKKLCINQLAGYQNGKRINLFVKAAADGIYKLGLRDIANIDTSNYKVYLIDTKLNDSLDIVHYQTYTFNFNATDTASFAHRFVLALEPKPTAPYGLISFSGQKAKDNTVGLNWNTVNEGDYTSFGLEKLGPNGSYTVIDSVQSNGSGVYSFNDQNPVTGNNIYRLAQNDIHGKVTFAGPININYNTISVSGMFTIYPNPSKGLINIAVNSGTTGSKNTTVYLARTYDLSGIIVDSRQVNDNNWTQDVTGYKAGVYILELKTAEGNVIGKAKFVKIN